MQPEPAGKRTRDKGETLSTAIFDALRREIISGQFAPDEKLNVRQLADRFGVGLSPAREALTRLSRDGLVRYADQRGFFIASVSEDDLQELTNARCWLNERAIREAISHGDSAWEEGIVLAFYRLSRIPRVVPGMTVKVNPDWEAAHRVFHRSLIDVKGSRWLTEFCEHLFDAADRYRNLARTAPSAERREEDHQTIVDAVLARDADRAAALITHHFQRTAELCREQLRIRQAAAAPARGRRRAEEPTAAE